MANITFVFDGLCLFVRRKQGVNGLHVLLPNTTHLNTMHQHNATIDVGQGEKPLHGVFDWRNGLPTGNGRRWGVLLPFSEEIGMSVPKARLEGAVGSGQADSVITRILLPLPDDSNVQARKSIPAGVRVPPPLEVRPTGRAAGVIAIRYTSTGPVTIFGVTIPATGAREITIAHRPKYPTNAPVGGYGRNHELEHAHIYIDKLFPNAPKRPVFVTEQPIPKDSVEVKLFPPGVPGVNPVICTLGGGCPPEDPSCDDD